MRILGIRLRFTVAVALALAGYVAFLPQKIDPGKNKPAETAPAPAPPQAVPPVAAPTQTSQQPTQPPAATMPQQPGSEPSAIQKPQDQQPTAQPATATTGSELPNGQPATPQGPGSPPAAGDPTATSSSEAPQTTMPEGSLTPNALTAAQRAAAQQPAAPDSALPTTDAPTVSATGRTGRNGAGTTESGGTKAPGDVERTTSPAASLTPNAQRLTPILLGGAAAGIPLPPKPRYNRGQYLADTALSFRGLPYKWGGTSPDTGMDCSGFIVAVCQKWHIDVPHSVIAQYQLGKSVRLAQIQPGDLMFFKNTYKPGLSHVAIYVGDNQFVDAGDEKAGVMLRELGPHGMEHWVGGRRLDFSLLPPAPGEPLLKHRK